MKKFLLKGFAAFVIFMLVSSMIIIRCFREPPAIKMAGEVFRAIDICMKPRPCASALLLGDSVAHQLFMPERYQNESEEITYATCNQAITAFGNHVLLEQYLKNNPQTKDVYYMVRPASLSNDGGRLFTFHYLIYPFLERGLYPFFHEGPIKHLKSRFGYLPFMSSSFRHFLYNNDNTYKLYDKYFVHIPEYKGETPPPMILSELRAMVEECEARGITFNLVPSPMNEESRKPWNGNPAYFTAIYEAVPSSTNYWNSTKFYPASVFQDGVHFTDEFLNNHRNEIVSDYFLKK